VAEHVFLLILSLYKQILEADLSIRRGEWRQFSLRANSFEVAGKKLGILGLGRIGEAVARRAVSFEAVVNYFDIKRRSQVEERQLGVAFKPFEELLEESDIVSLHLPITPNTYHIMDSHAFGLMRTGSILINTARGELIDTQAMLKALQNGQLGGAGLDVFEIEPPNPDDPLLKMPNVLLTPHIAAGTRDALIAKMDAAFANMIRVTRGEPPWHIVEA
jgi:phosphoglycerate dehydrogenase-like enzyme